MRGEIIKGMVAAQGKLYVRGKQGSKADANSEAGVNDVQASTIYCPYADHDIPISESSPEHIIPLALGGMNGFSIPVSKDFNSSVGSEFDGALANDFLVMSKRDKHGNLQLW